jgi:hypothetical protein
LLIARPMLLPFSKYPARISVRENAIQARGWSGYTFVAVIPRTSETSSKPSV